MSDTPALEVLPLGAGRYEVVEGTRRRLAHAVRGPDGTWVSLDGRVYLIEAPARSGSRASRSRADDATALAPPMPATVVSVHVTPGQRVRRGDLLITLEAMKMEIALTAPRDAAVLSVRCRAGELVPPGVPLLELE